MNKKLVAVAVAGMLAAPLAAQAQTANVTLYGRLNLDMEVVNVKQDATANPPANQNGFGKQNVFRVMSNSSRLGVRGTEALGGGLSAVFQIESAVGAATGGGLGSTLGTRETFVGLQGGWGTVKMGYFLTPYDDIHPIFGNVPTLATSILGTQALWSNTGWAGNYQYGGAFDDRAPNSVRYDSPNIAGFTGSIQVSAATAGGDPTNGPQAITTGIVASGTPTGTTLAQQRRHAYLISLNGLYNNGPFQGGIAYETHNNMRPPTSPSLANPLNPDTNQWTSFRLQDQALVDRGLVELRRSQGWRRVRANQVRHRHRRRAQAQHVRRQPDLEPRSGTAVRDVRLRAGRRRFGTRQLAGRRHPQG